MSTGDCNYDLVQKQHPKKGLVLRSKDGAEEDRQFANKYVRKIIEMFKNNVPQRKIEEIWIFHLQQCIT